MADLVKTSIRISTTTNRRLSDDLKNTSSVEITNTENERCDSFDFDIDVTTYDADDNIQNDGINGNQRSVKTSTTLNFNMVKRESKDIKPMTTIDENSNEINRSESVSCSAKEMKETIHNRNKSTTELDEAKDIDIPPIRISSSVDNLLYENGQLYNKLAECDREYITRSERTIAKAPCRPKKPKRSVKYDRDRCTFVPWTSDESVSEKLNVVKDSQNNYIIPEEELDKFIQREKGKFSGEVLKNSCEFLYKTHTLDAFAAGLVDYRDLELACNKSSLEQYGNISLASSGFLTVNSSTQKISDTASSISTLVTVNTGNSTPPEFDIDNQRLSSAYSRNLSEDSRKYSLDSSICTLNLVVESPISLTEISETQSPMGSDWSYMKPMLRTDLPPPPEDKNKFSKRLGRIGKSIKNVSRIITNQKAPHSPSIPKRSSSLKHTRSKDKLTDDGFNSRSRDKLTEGAGILKTTGRDQIADDGYFSRDSDDLYNGKKMISNVRTSKIIALECERQERYLKIERAKIEEERLRLMDLKRQVAEKSELERINRIRQLEQRKVEEKEIKAKKEELSHLEKEHEIKTETERRMLNEETEKVKRHEELLRDRENELLELHKERTRREELEQLLETKEMEQNILDQSLNKEKEKLNALERNFAEEKARRLEIEKKLLVEESRNRINEKDKIEKKMSDSGSVGNGVTTAGNLAFRKRTSPFNLSLRSAQSAGNVEETNLLHHITALGHAVDNCPEVKLNRTSCCGYLQKMGKSRLKVSWKRRWFVFDRNMRAFCYYQDQRKTRSIGVLYFQSIQEVYVDSAIKRSPNSRTTFCIRTPTRLYVLAAPSPIAMSIWIDVLCTGKEGAFISSIV